MPAKTNRIPKLRRQPDRNGPGRAFVVLGGERTYLGTWGTPEAQSAYDRTIAAWLAGGRRLPSAPDPRARGSAGRPGATEPPLAVYLADYWAEMERVHARRPNTLTKIKTALGPVRRLYGDRPLTELGPRALLAIREAMIGEGWTYTTVNAQANRVIRFVRWCVRQEHAPAEQWQALQAVEPLRADSPGAKVRPKRTAANLRHVVRAMRQMPPTLRDLVRLQFTLGCRAGELVGIRAADIDMGRADDKGVWYVRLEKHKTAHHGHARTLVLGPRAQKILRPYLIGRPITSPLFSPRQALDEWRRMRAAAKGRELKGRRPGQAPSPTKTDREVGEAYTPTSYRRAVERACKAAKVPVWTPHQLRHAARRRFEDAGGVEAAQRALGHARIGTTELYGERSLRTVEALMLKVG